MESSQAGEEVRLAGTALLVTGHLRRLQAPGLGPHKPVWDSGGPCLLDSTPAMFVCLSSCQVAFTYMSGIPYEAREAVQLTIDSLTCRFVHNLLLIASLLGIKRALCTMYASGFANKLSLL